MTGYIKKGFNTASAMCLILTILIIPGCSRRAQKNSIANTAALTAENTGQPQVEETLSDSVPESTPEQFPDIERKPRRIENKYGVYYEIFVRSFADSDNDGIGDFRGLTSRIDYLNDGDPRTDTDLGIDGIYLMPVNVSPSYHKYDVTDYYDIDPEYGSMEDFRAFIDAAHKRGIKVIMDFVANHTSREHPWFRESSGSPDNPLRGFYNWAAEGDKGYDVNSRLASGSKLWHQFNGSYYYAYFWDGMPDLNYDNPDVRKEIKAAAKFWLEKGADGFRLDAAMHIYGVYEKPAGTDLASRNVQWWKEFGAALEETNPDVYLVGEVWGSTGVIAPYYKGIDSLFNFDVGEGIVKIIQSGSAMAVGRKGFSAWLDEKYEAYTQVEQNYLDAPFLTNHDQNRIMDRLRGDIAKAKLAAGIYLTLPGNPFIYYGEEIGMSGSKPDENIRVPFVWFRKARSPQCAWESVLNNADTVPEEVQQKDPGSLLNYYKKLIKLRHMNKALIKGDFEPLDTGSRTVTAYARSLVEDGNLAERVIVVHNVSGDVQKVLIKEDIRNAKVLFDSTAFNNKYDSAPGKMEDRLKNAVCSDAEGSGTEAAEDEEASTEAAGAKDAVSVEIELDPLSTLVIRTR